MAFAPSDIAGLRLWLKADQITGLADGAGITTWSDQSGNAFNGTGAGGANPTYKTALTPAGGPAVLFSSASKSRFTFGNVMASAAAGEIFLVVRSPGVDCGMYAFGVSTGADECHYPFGGIVYDSFGLATGGRKNFAPTLSISSQFRKYNVYNDGTTWQAALDGAVQLSTSTAVTVGWNPTPEIGVGLTTAAAVDYGFGGWVAEVVVYNSVLSGTNRANVLAYLDRHFSPASASVPVRFHPGRGPVVTRSARFYRTPRSTAGPRALSATETGQAIAGIVTSATARRVAPQTGLAVTGTATLAAGRKAAPATGRAVAAAVTTVTGRKVAPAVGLAAVGVVSTRMSAAGRAVAAVATVGAHALATVGHVAVQTTTAVAGALTAGSGRKIAPTGQRVTAGVTTTAAGRKAAPQTGTAPAGVVSAGTVRHVAARTASAVAGVLTAATGLKRAPAQAVASVGVVSTRTSLAGRIVTALATVGAHALSSVRHVAARNTAAVAGASSTATVRHVAARNTAAVTGASSSGTARHVGKPSGLVAAVIISQSGVTRRAGEAGQATVGVVARVSEVAAGAYIPGYLTGTTRTPVMSTTAGGPGMAGTSRTPGTSGTTTTAGLSGTTRAPNMTGGET